MTVDKQLLEDPWGDPGNPHTVPNPNLNANPISGFRFESGPAFDDKSPDSWTWRKEGMSPVGPYREAYKASRQLGFKETYDNLWPAQDPYFHPYQRSYKHLHQPYKPVTQVLNSKPNTKRLTDPHNRNQMPYTQDCCSF